MDEHVSHDWSEESSEAKARWFAALPVEERMEMLCAFTDLILDLNPGIQDAGRHAQPDKGRIQIISRT